MAQSTACIKVTDLSFIHLSSGYNQGLSQILQPMKNPVLLQPQHCQNSLFSEGHLGLQDTIPMNPDYPCPKQINDVAHTGHLSQRFPEKRGT